MGSPRPLKPIHLFSLTLAEFEDIFENSPGSLEWNCLFVLPFWLRNWWQVFGAEKTPMILAVRKENAIIGVAPLMVEGNTAMFMGSESLCDYQDMVLTKSCPDDFFTGLLEYLQNRDVSRLVLGALRPDSNTLSGISEAAKKLGLTTKQTIVDRFYELPLPDTWNGYLNLLAGKQRHEVRRKIRRIQEIGNIRHRVIDNPVLNEDDLENFFFLFESSRNDKAQFLTEEMKSFFRAQIRSLAKRDMLQFGFLYINDMAVAATLCFKYRNRLFLYNSGYHPEFADLSPGTVAKVLSIRHGILNRIGWYDFLKGDEDYKQRLGGRPVPLYRLTVHIS